jgi:hypothetical protein
MLFNSTYNNTMHTQSAPMDSSFNWLFFLSGSLLVALITYCVYKRIMRKNEEHLQELLDEQEPGSPRRYLTI